MNPPGGLSKTAYFYYPDKACDAATLVYNYEFRNRLNTPLWGHLVLASLGDKK